MAVRYVDVYLLPVPRRNLPAYRRLAKRWSKVMRDHGVLEYRELVASSKKPLMKKAPPVAPLAKPRAGEVSVCAYACFRDKAHHDRVNTAAMKDPRMQKIMKESAPFDMKRMRIGEFEVLLEG